MMPLLPDACAINIRAPVMWQSGNGWLVIWSLLDWWRLCTHTVIRRLDPRIQRRSYGNLFSARDLAWMDPRVKPEDDDGEVG
jgi:hypothetical protein